MKIEEMRVGMGHHVANILEHEHTKRGLDISDEAKLQQLWDWWVNPNDADSGLRQYMAIKAANRGDRDLTFKTSGQIVVEKFKSL